MDTVSPQPSMPQFIVTNPAFRETVNSIFQQQGMMQLLDAQLISVAAGEVTIELPFSPKISQHNGYIHAAALTAVVDTACGSAALTLMPPDSNVLTIEYKVNFLSPALGVKLLAIGQVVKPGRNVTVCRGDVWAFDAENNSKLCAIMTATMMRQAATTQR